MKLPDFEYYIDLKAVAKDSFDAEMLRGVNIAIMTYMDEDELVHLTSEQRIVVKESIIMWFNRSYDFHYLRLCSAFGPRDSVTEYKTKCERLGVEFSVKFGYL